MVSHKLGNIFKVPGIFRNWERKFAMYYAGVGYFLQRYVEVYECEWDSALRETFK